MLIHLDFMITWLSLIWPVFPTRNFSLSGFRRCLSMSARLPGVYCSVWTRAAIPTLLGSSITPRYQIFPGPGHKINMQKSGQRCKSHRKFGVVFRSHLRGSVGNGKERALISSHHCHQRIKVEMSPFSQCSSV